MSFFLVKLLKKVENWQRYYIYRETYKFFVFHLLFPSFLRAHFTSFLRLFSSFICIFFLHLFLASFSASFFHIFSWIIFGIFFSHLRKRISFAPPWSFRLTIVIECQSRITCFEIFWDPEKHHAKLTPIWYLGRISIFFVWIIVNTKSYDKFK